jgi:putative heme-binding domain-containing protein
LANPQAAAQTPEWIWTSAESAKGDRMWTCHVVEVTGEVKKASLFGSCDNHCSVFLDGKLVLESHEWSVRSEADLRKALTEGQHSLAVRCRNDGGPAGLWLELVIEYKTGTTQTLVTDGSWMVTGEESPGWRAWNGSRDGWQAAVSLGAMGVQPWGNPGAPPPGSISEALAADQLELPVGFEAELLYSVPKDTQGSWVSVTFDPQGRLIACDQYGSIYRMRLPEWGVGLQAADIEPLGVEIGSAHGLLHAFGYLYVVVAAGKGTGLYRVGDSDGDDAYDSVEFLMPLDGSGEHGPHAVILSPDGEALYIVGGNHTFMPDTIARSRPTKAWGEDQLLPRLPDPNGHAVGRMAPGGWVCRVSPDGQRWELVAMGMRNAYDIAFNPEGELFTYDSDMEWDVGLPWYRPTRILHLVSGADFGWRNGSGKWPAHSPDSLPAVVDVGLGSPTGIVFGTDTAFHGAYRRALFAADWAYGTIHAVHIEPRGASYSARLETFVSGKPFPVTDLAVGLDGSLYITTGGRRTQSGLYRIRSTRTAADPPAAAVADGSRALRHAIEREHGLEVMSPYWSQLAHADRFIAHAARVALEQTPLALWGDRALAEEDPSLALQALLALARVGSQDQRIGVLERMAAMPFDSFDEKQLLGWLRVLGVASARGGEVTRDAALRLRPLLQPRFPSDNPELDRELCRVLAYLQSPALAALAVETLENSEVPADQIHYALCLSHLREGWTLPLRRRYFRWLDEQAPALSGGHSLTKYIAKIRAQAVDTLPAELKHWPELLRKPTPPAGARVIEAAATRFVRAWTLDDLAGSLARMTTEPRDLERGARFFERATCAECHRFDGQGGSTGPDLTGASGRFSAHDLLESILSPSLAISDQYQQVELLTTDGEVFVGRIEEQDESHLVLRTGVDYSESLEFQGSEIESLRPSPLSRMPTGLLDSMTEDAILDLLAYCLSK